MKRICHYIVLLSLFSCKQRFFREPSVGMEETIKRGESFYVTLSDKFERNDIVVFDYFGPDYSSPAEEPGKFNNAWQKRMYRLIACSGDTFEIKDGEVYVNSRHVPAPDSAKLQYEVLSTIRVEEFENNDNGPYASLRGDTIVYITGLTREKALDYQRRKPAIISVKRRLPNMALNENPNKKSVLDAWTSDNYGPLRLPSPGDNIEVDSTNYILYQNIPGIRMGKNILREKLYFVLGDSRYEAADSRYTGLIAHSKMYGIVK